MTRWGARVRKIVWTVERWLLGGGRLLMLLMGVCLVAGAIIIMSSSSGEGGYRFATVLAGLGAATWALWATAARVNVTREGARGALLAAILARYHSESMWEAMDCLSKYEDGCDVNGSREPRISDVPSTA